MIRKSLLKFTTVGLLGVMCTGVTAFAQTGEFKFSIPGGESQWTSKVEKSDNEQNWYCTPTFFALAEGDYVTCTVYSGDKTQKYTSKRADDLKHYKVAYSASKPAKANKKYVLKGKGPANKTAGGVSLSGRWTP